MAGEPAGGFGAAEAADEVAFLVRPRRKAEIDRDGLIIESPTHGDFRAKVRTIAAQDAVPGWDIVLLTCKAYDLADAIEAIRPAVDARTAVLLHDPTLLERRDLLDGILAAAALSSNEEDEPDAGPEMTMRIVLAAPASGGAVRLVTVTNGCELPTRATADLRADAVAFTVYGQNSGGGCTAESDKLACREVVLPQAVGPRRVVPEPDPRHRERAEALVAATVGGARALRRSDIGHIAVGARADLAVLDAPSFEHLAYRPGMPLARALDLS